MDSYHVSAGRGAGFGHELHRRERSWSVSFARNGESVDLLAKHDAVFFASSQLVPSCVPEP